MYRPTLNKRDRAGVITAVVAIHAGLAFALLHMSGTVDLIPEQRDLQIFDVNQPEPPPPAVIQQVQEKAPEKEGEASPPNIKSEATPVVRPKPKIEVPAPPTVVASPTPNEGAAPTQGAAPVPGPGTGAGGIGDGLGAGGSGSGRGGGGGLAAVRTRLATRPLVGRDFPDRLLDAWPRGAMAYMRLRVDANGNVIRCIMDRGTGNPAMDAEICAIVRQRLRYRPALDRDGRPVADWAGYRQEPPH